MLARHLQELNGRPKVSAVYPTEGRGGLQELTLASGLDEYFRFVKPGLKQPLELLGLDVNYVRGRDDRLYYKDATGREIEILDLVGGFGASFFGHNHPEIKSVLEGRIRHDQPMLTQGSNQAETGRLASRLSAQLCRVTGKSYVCTFGNSGAEAVDIAMKHSELERALKTERILQEMRCGFDIIRGMHGSGQRIFGLEGVVRMNPDRGGTAAWKDTLDLTDSHNRRVLGRGPLYLAMERAFHGKTIGSLSLTYNPDYRKPFNGLLQQTRFLDPSDPRGVEKAFEASLEDYFAFIPDGSSTVRVEKRQISNLAALIAEPIQGEGGIRPLGRELLQECRRLCDQYDIPLIFDEIQSGLGRTGRFFASEHQGVVGDIYLLSKALGAGLAKISATLISRDRYIDEFSLLHSSTFAEDSLSSAVGNRVLDLLEREHLAKRAEEKGEYLKGRLAELTSKYPEAVQSVRGKGLMLGVVLCEQRESGSPMIREMEKAGRLAYFASGYLFHQEKMRVLPTLSDPHVLRLEPSVYISYPDLDRVVNAFEGLAEVLTKCNAHALLKHIAGDPSPSLFPVKSFRRQPKKNNTDPSLRKAGFLVHLVDERQLQALEPSLVSLTPGQSDRFIRRMMPVAGPMHVSSVDVASKTGDRINFNLIAVPITSRHMAECLEDPDRSPALKMVKDAVRLAREMGCEVVGLGQYTSIISNNGLAISEPGLTITTGNSFTVASTVQAVLKAVRLKGLDPDSVSLSLVGAAGNIGSAYAAMIARHFCPLNLVGSSKEGSLERLTALRDRIIEECYGMLIKMGSASVTGGIPRRLLQIPLVRELLEGGRDPRIATGLLVSAGVLDGAVSISTDISSIGRSQVIVAVSNSHEKLIRSDYVRPGAVLCDVSVPCSTDPEIIRNRKDVLFFAGGIVKLPKGEAMGTPAFPLPAGHVYACMAETMLLTLSGLRENLSYGSVQPEGIRLIEKIAQDHGFHLGALESHTLSPLAALANQEMFSTLAREKTEDKEAEACLWR